MPLVLRPESTPANVWAGEYYANASLDGDPAYTTQETRIDYDWGSGGAPSGLPTDYFSIRWTGDWELEHGEYTFFVYADDGVRLWLDGDLLIDAWGPGMGLHQVTRIIQTAGRHTLKLEYFEQTGGAAIQVRWRRTDLYPLWHGDYYNQPWVEFGWLYEQFDNAIQFDWGEGCPDYLPCDALFGRLGRQRRSLSPAPTASTSTPTRATSSLSTATRSRKAAGTTARAAALRTPPTT